MAVRFCYFATPTDLKKIIATIDSTESYQYVEYKNFSVDEYQSALHLKTLLEYPNIGYSKSGYCDDEIFLVLPNDKELQIARRSGSAGERIVIGQDLNVPSITWALGGVWKNNTLLKGEVSTIHGDTISRCMLKQIKRGFSKHCSLLKGYYISPEVEQLQGVRLVTISDSQPPEYDLHLSD